MKVYCIGSATLDIFFIYENLDFLKNPKLISEKNQVPEIFIDLGGGGLNSAFNFKNLNLETQAIIKLGKDFIGRIIEEKIKIKKIPAKIIRTNGFSTFSVIFLNKNTGEKKIFVYRGDEIFNERDIPIFSNSAYFLITGSTSLNIWLNIVKKLRKKDNFIGIIPSRNFLSKKIAKDVLNYVDFVSLNEEEAKLFLGKNEKKVSKEDLCQSLKKILPNPIFKVVTFAEEGACLIYGNKIYFVEAFKRFKTIDTTGAGDCFTSTLFAFLVKYLNKIDEIKIKYALKFASINSAHNLKEIGAQTGILKEKDLLKYKNYNLKVLVKNIL